VVAKVRVLNTAHIPEWRKLPFYTAGIPANFDKFISYLTTTQKSKDATIGWMRNCVFSRNETYLVLNGKKGIGKGYLSETIKALVGAPNYAEAQRSFLKKEFNSVLRNKLAFNIDEIKANDDDKIDNLKRYINATQTLEAKGVEARESEPIHCSIIISNNGANDLKLEHDDRRYLVPDITNEIMEEAFTPRELNQFWDCLKDENYIRELGNFLFSSPHQDPFYILRDSGHFNKLVRSSLEVWKEKTVEYFETKHDSFINNEIKLSDVIHHVRKESQRSDVKAAMKNDRYIDFIHNFKVDGHPLGEVVNVDGVLIVKVGKAFRK